MKPDQFPFLSPEPSPPMTPAELKAFRKDELKVPQSTAAGLLGVSLDTLRSWEQGKYPISETAARLVVLWRQFVAFRDGALAQNRELALEVKVRDGMISDLQGRLAALEARFTDIKFWD